MADPSTPSPDLDWTEAGPRSGRFGDVYFSQDDGLAESRAVFLHGCGLPAAWASRTRFVVGELGFGTGLNIAALLTLWRAHRPKDGQLRIFSIEAFPMTGEDAARALSAWPEVADAAAALTRVWPRRTPGFHRLDLPEFHAVLDLAIGDAAWALAQWQGRADAWFLDGFSPSLNPQMWSDAVLDGVAARSRPDARLATFTVAGAVRRGLQARGFTVDKRPGHGRKRERLEARLTGAPSSEPSPRVAVIGAGVAGAAMARALMDLGVLPVVIEADQPGAGASGFPAALVTPRLDAGDAGIAGLAAQALARAAALYDATPDAITARGVLQLEGGERDAGRFAKVAAQPIWADGEMQRLEASETGEAIGEPSSTGALAMAGARAIQPNAVLDAWLPAPTVRIRIDALEPVADGWRLQGSHGQVVNADAVVIAAGWGAAALAPGFHLAPVRGQAEWVEGRPGPAVAWGGYVAPAPDGWLFGATHDRGRTDAAPDADSAARNAQNLAERLPTLAAHMADTPTVSRAAIRATTRDRLPIAGAVPGSPGLYILSGLGSRGFTFAPLLAEHVAALILDAPSPLPADAAGRVSPDRLIVAEP
jgi:tRNA 5-methylaminomethyl-2-thiouridine biosynthesis bifunctional protein